MFTCNVFAVQKMRKTTSRRQYGIKNYLYSDSLTLPRNVKNKYVILRHLGDMCLFTSAPRASVNKSHTPSLPQNNLYIFPLNCWRAGGGGGHQKFSGHTKKNFPDISQNFP